MLAAIGFAIQDQVGIAIGCVAGATGLFAAGIAIGRILTAYDRGLRRIALDFSESATRLVERPDLEGKVAETSGGDVEMILHRVASEIESLRPPRRVRREHDELLEFVKTATTHITGETQDSSAVLGLANGVVERANAILERLEAMDENAWESG